MTTKEVLDLKDPDIEKAVMMPTTSQLATSLFYLMLDLVDSCYITAGMSGTIIAIDQDKMETMAQRREIDLSRYNKPVKHFTRTLLTSINKENG